ncbi:hypothetical protein JMJ77_0009488 [Colletotrichum scovillei]|uniref:Uncharacterized protein n=1 Tax=Colletotrichum scovillei TaxID=1209932 RepID=A0A9P7R059_9PEZI|nr:hypothetical protein JMJ77_0009488 [Colletotrichum scovillei]KAG7052569.1 hypothetical protein JMJ78_0005585 [Colletotrichum scovillei]KAG7064858.1 hypothetical protein JMJ76_0012616 [Colletotrichum scovillei]
MMMIPILPVRTIMKCERRQRQRQIGFGEECERVSSKAWHLQDEHVVVRPTSVVPLLASTRLCWAVCERVALASCLRYGK